MDIDFKQFLENFKADVSSMVYTEGDGAIFEDKFTEYCLEILENAGETEGPVAQSYIYPGDQGKDWKINGYALRDSYKDESKKTYYETLDLFITQYQQDYDYTITKDVFTKGLNQLKRFLNGALKGHIDYLEPSNTIAELVKLIYRQGHSFDRINIYYLINGSSYQKADKIVIKGFQDLGVYLHVWDIQRFFRLSVSSTEREAIEINVIDFMPDGSHGIQCLKVPAINDLYECYLAILPGSLLSKLYAEYSSKLLESNVRAFLGQNGKYNSGIRDTIKKKPHMFLPYNNGLSATAEFVETQKLDSSLYITKLNDFQIVNGGQTTASLYHTEKLHKDVDLNQIFVQMKLTVIKDAVDKNIEVPFIANFANSQNKISALDLSSNNPYFVKIEELSRRKYVSLPGNSNQQILWFFERVNGQYREFLSRQKGNSLKIFKEKNPLTNKYNKAEVTKLITLWELEPYLVSLGPVKNFPLFNKKISVLVSKNKLPGENFYKILISNAIIYRSVDKMYGRKNVDAIGDTNIKSFILAYTISYFHHITGNTLDLWKIYEDQKLEKDLEYIFKELLLFVHNYMTNAASGTLFSEYAKKESSWILLKSQNYSLDKFPIGKYIISPEEALARQQENENVDVENEIIMVSKITSLGLKFWDGLKLHIRNTGQLQELEFHVWDLIKIIRDQKNLDHSALRTGKIVLEMIEKNLLDVDSIKQLSALPELETVDLKAIYDRINMLKKEDWSKLIALSEQTHIFDTLEISNLKSVQRAILSKDKVKEASLLKANDSLIKLKRFNIKY
ncbi:AIPR family protein [Pedobacter sp. AW31-3R]|uniref:AIPR family protein n=1 Tax=Pedobacter sp. AW31-3R TaxID=3445781 RepID=UPI003FA00141